MTLVSPNLVDTLLRPHLATQQHTSHGASPLSQVSRPWVLRRCSLLVGLRPHTLVSDPQLSLLTCAAFFTWTHKIVLRIRGWPSSLLSPHFCLSGFILSHVPLLLVTLKFIHSAKTSLTSDFCTHVWWPMWRFHMNVSQLDVTCPKRNSWFPVLSKQILLAGSASSLSSHPSANLTHFISAPRISCHLLHSLHHLPLRLWFLTSLPTPAPVFL